MPLLADAHISSLGYLWGTQQSILREGSAPDDDRIVSHDAPRFMLYYHRVRDTL